jgi:hypothetical protein
VEKKYEGHIAIKVIEEFSSEAFMKVKMKDPC